MIYLSSVLNFFIFLLSIFFFQYSISGYQSFFFQDQENKFINFLLTIIILNIFSYALYLISMPTNYFSIIIWVIGFFLFLKKNSFKDNYLNSALILLLLSGVLISKTHEDFITWHLPYLLNIYNESLIIGIGNKEINFVYAPFFSFFQILFFNEISEYNLVNIGVFLILVNFISFHINQFFKLKNLLSLFLVIFTLIKYSRFSEYGYDFLPLIILISIFYYFITSQNTRNFNINIMLILFLFAISIRSISLFFLPLFAFLLVKSNKIKLNFDKYFIIFFLLLISYISNNFLKSGCLLFFIEQTCTSFSWAVDIINLNAFSLHVELWAKSFFTQKIILDPNYYLNDFVWVKFWIKKHFFYKVNEYLLILILIFILIFFKTEFNKNKVSKLLIFFSILNILFWFTFLPQLRFGAVNFIIIFLIILTSCQLDHVSKYLKTLIILCFLIFNAKNIYRINDEFSRNDKYKFTNFPYISVHEELAKTFTYNKKLLNISFKPSK